MEGAALVQTCVSPKTVKTKKYHELILTRLDIINLLLKLLSCAYIFILIVNFLIKKRSFNLDTIDHISYIYIHLHVMIY